MDNHATGLLGESIAAKFLRDKGYKVIERNFRTLFGEIDIVARRKNVLVFVEVKALADNPGFDPELHFTPQKLAKMKRTVKAYLKDKQIIDTDYQLDLIAIELGQDNAIKDLRHYENITV